MATLTTTIILFLGLFLPFIPLSCCAKDEIVVNIAAAHNNEYDSWAKYIFWQQPDTNALVVQQRGKSKVDLPSTIAPKKNSPLAAHYIKSRKSEGVDSLVLWYHDKDDKIIRQSFQQRDGEYIDHHTSPTRRKSASGLAAVQLGLHDSRRYYIDEEASIVEDTDDRATKLPGPRAASGSIVYAAVPTNSTDIHVFFIAEDMSLSSLSWNGDKWSEALPPLENFASDPKMAFAVAAWSDPQIIRVFYINEHLSASEWTLREGKRWANTTDDMPTNVEAIEPGQPVAASRSANGTGRYIEYFYAGPTGQINYAAANYVDEPYFLHTLAPYKVPPSPEGLSRSDIIAIASIVVATCVAFMIACIRREWIKGVARKVFRRRSQKVVAEEDSSA